MPNNYLMSTAEIALVHKAWLVYVGVRPFGLMSALPLVGYVFMCKLIL